MARNEIYLHIMRKINVSFNSVVYDDDEIHDHLYGICDTGIRVVLVSI